MHSSSGEWYGAGRAIYFGDVDDEGEDDDELKERAIQSALSSAVPFTVAAASMVVCPSTA